MEPQPLDHTFTGVLGDDLPEGWDCVVMRGSKEFFGTGKGVKVAASINGVQFTTAMLPTGSGDHMLPIKADVRKATGVQRGDTIEVHLEKRLS